MLEGKRQRMARGRERAARSMVAVAARRSRRRLRTCRRRRGHHMLRAAKSTAGPANILLGAVRLLAPLVELRTALLSQPKRSSAFCLTRNHHQCSRLSCSSPYRRPPPTHTLALMISSGRRSMSTPSLVRRRQPRSLNCWRPVEKRLRLLLRPLRWQPPWQHTPHSLPVVDILQTHQWAWALGPALAASRAASVSGNFPAYMTGVHVALLLQAGSSAAFGVQALRSLGDAALAEKRLLLVAMSSSGVAALSAMRKFKPKKAVPTK